MSSPANDLTNRILLANSAKQTRLFKNVRGGMYPIASVKPLIGAILSGQLALAQSIAKKLHPIMAGLGMNGASDLIGYTMVTITQEMVGQKVAVFTVQEVKAGADTVKPEQQTFIDIVLKDGGKAGVVRTIEDAIKIIS